MLDRDRNRGGVVGMLRPSQRRQPRILRVWRHPESEGAGSKSPHNNPAAGWSSLVVVGAKHASPLREQALSVAVGHAGSGISPLLMRARYAVPQRASAALPGIRLRGGFQTCHDAVPQSGALVGWRRGEAPFVPRSPAARRPSRPGGPGLAARTGCETACFAPARADGARRTSVAGQTSEAPAADKTRMLGPDVGECGLRESTGVAPTPGAGCA
jgi:hypothetical protein